jgi:hypothetical protein
MCAPFKISSYFSDTVGSIIRRPRPQILFLATLAPNIAYFLSHMILYLLSSISDRAIDRNTAFNKSHLKQESFWCHQINCNHVFDSKRTQLLPCVVTDEHRCFCITYAFSFSFQKAKLLRKGFNLAVGVTYPIIMTLSFIWARFFKNLGKWISS